MAVARPVSVYRHLYRTANQTFKGDAAMLSVVRKELKEYYAKSEHVTDPAEVNKLCDEADDLAQFLSSTIVQAKLNERGNYAMQPEERHLDARGNLIAQSPEDLIKPADR